MNKSVVNLLQKILEGSKTKLFWANLATMIIMITSFAVKYLGADIDIVLFEEALNEMVMMISTGLVFLGLGETGRRKVKRNKDRKLEEDQVQEQEQDVELVG